MATDATLQSISARRADASSTAWFWWKETRQLAPLVVLLVIVAMMIVLISSVWGVIGGGPFSFRLPYAVTLLVFPGLFATGAGPLLVGQERSQRTLDWLVLLPISARRLVATKLYVAMAGLAVMWGFAFLVVAIFDLSTPATGGRWSIGRGPSYSDNPLSYPVWISHSLFVLLAGFYVAWRIRHQFYSLLALIPLAFSPFMVTGIVSHQVGRTMLARDLDWFNFGFTLLGIGLIAPLTYRAAMRALGPDPAPPVRALLDASPYSPAKDAGDTIAPEFSTTSAPIIWQSIHSARGMLSASIGMLLISFLVAMPFAVDDYPGGGLSGIPVLAVLLAPLAVCWLGIGVFKHDGDSERIRFLADRGVSPVTTYFALHAVPTAILSTSLLVYGLWNLTLSHRETVSSFAAGLPSLVTMLMYGVLIYGISQWVSQFVRTLILSVILAPILSLITIGWLTFAYVSLGMPVYGLILCAIAPLIATFSMMRRYMDSRDRPATFVMAILVVSVITLTPIGFATARVLSVPTMVAKTRNALLSEAARLRQGEPPVVSLSISGFGDDYRRIVDPLRDPVEELRRSLADYSLDPQRIVAPLRSFTPDSNRFAHVQPWEYRRWHGGLTYARIAWREEQSDQAWSSLANWLDASSILLPALRKSTILSDQEIADRLEVLLIDALQKDVSQDRRDDPAVQSVLDAMGTRASRAEARRGAVLVTWLNSLEDYDSNRNQAYFFLTEIQPHGLTPWIWPRIYEAYVEAMLEGIEASAKGSDERSWRLTLHHIHQSGGVFETSRYGDALRSRPAIQTMSLDVSRRTGQLWGRDWEDVKPDDLFR